MIEERGGYLIKGLQDVFPEQKPIDRTFINTWEDNKVVDLVKKSGRPYPHPDPEEPTPDGPAFIEAARQMGIPIHADLNGPMQAGGRTAGSGALAGNGWSFQGGWSEGGARGAGVAWLGGDDCGYGIGWPPCGGSRQ